MHKIGGTLDKTVTATLFRAELQEAAVLDPRIGEIGAEVVECLLTVIAAGKSDLDALCRAFLTGPIIG